MVLSKKRGAKNLVWHENDRCAMFERAAIRKETSG